MDKGHGDQGGSNPSAPPPPHAPPPYEDFGQGQFGAEMKPPNHEVFDPVPPTMGKIY